MGIDWKRKLSSRKFWAALAGFVGAVAVFCGAGESMITEVTAIISAAGVLIAYILGESIIDSSSEYSEHNN
jgi:drug/metabolite transporter (DMT)-like permease